MEKKVYEYVKSHAHSDVHSIAKAICIEEKDTLRLICELADDGYVKMDTPLQINDNNFDSCRYSVTDKFFCVDKF